MPTPPKTYQYLDIITVLFVSILLISNIASTKILLAGPFTFDGGTILFPLSYILGDILTEIYGYDRARRVIWLGFISALLLALCLIVVQHLPAAPDWPNQEAYEKILGWTPRIIIASLIAYFAGSFSNAFILAKMKIWTRGKHLWLRTIGSSIIGELIDSVIFVSIAFLGQIPLSLLFSVLISNYVFKCAAEIIFTPITYKIIRNIKSVEHEDYYDRQTEFNPFQWAHNKHKT